ncbi:MAG: 2-oxoglutarate dehydrogenase complex dihydrolipoyllysine-residue succinyltransferase [Oligoflexales bacterium]|nr:2-oxoglutarate dehydrogenase complex dihydrolipoyllysine-residue succinyltransferase [Oligoflexales bacterium]
MAIEVKVPGVGESVQEGMIESWHKASGDWVQQDDVLLELETDKATVEVVSEGEGKLEILVEAGEVVKVGDLIARIDTSAHKPAGSQGAAGSAEKAEEAPSQDKSNHLENGPAVRRILSENPVDASQITGSGRSGRLTKGDVLGAIQQGGSQDRAPAPSSPALEKKQQELPAPRSLSGERESTRKPMSMLRRRIAERLLTAQSSAAILTTFNEVDMTEVMDLRKRYKDAFQERYGIKLGFMGFFLKASVHALETFPAVNAYIDGTDVIYHNYCDVGVAVSTEKGLMVPIVRDVDKLSLADVELEIGRYAQKARENKISLDDLSGGTFTVSNGGVFGSLLSTPILNPPQSAILGMHKTQMRPVVMPDGSIKARPMMYLALSYDHRIVDGKEAVGFLVKIKEAIEDPSRLLLGV